MRPHPEDLDDTLHVKHLVDQPVLDVDAPGERATPCAWPRSIATRSPTSYFDLDAVRPIIGPEEPSLRVPSQLHSIRDAIREYLSVVEEQLRGEEVREIEVAV